MPPSRLVPSPRSLALALRGLGIVVWSSHNSAGYEHAGLRPELIKGRLGSDQERRRDQPPPERMSRPAAQAGRARRAEDAAAANENVCPRRRSRTGEKDPPMSMRKACSRIGRRRKERPATDVGSAPRSRQASLGEGQTLVKAGLRPPPPAASTLTRVWPSPSSAAREIEGRGRALEGWERALDRRRRQKEKKRGALLTTKPPYESPAMTDRAVR
jgi:hypothetical protein